MPERRETRQIASGARAATAWGCRRENYVLFCAIDGESIYENYVRLYIGESFCELSTFFDSRPNQAPTQETAVTAPFPEATVWWSRSPQARERTTQSLQIR